MDMNGFRHSFKEKKLEVALLLSLVIHASIFYYVPGTFEKEIKTPEKKMIVVSLEKRETKNSVVPVPSRQIVNSEQTGEKKLDEKTRFLGESNQFFERQTIARTINTFKEAGRGGQTGAEKSAAKSEKKKDVINSLQGTKEISLSDLAVTRVMNDNVPISAKKGTGKTVGLQNGKDGVTGFASNNDFIEDIPLGDMTNINTAEFKYFGYYHRIRQKLEQYWGNSLRDKAERLYKSGRRLPASENVITSLTITIDNKGSIVDVAVKGTSGFKELDDAAIESFNKAGPFPNPPSGMLVNGKAEIEWGFVVKS